MVDTGRSSAKIRAAAPRGPTSDPLSARAATFDGFSTPSNSTKPVTSTSDDGAAAPSGTTSPTRTATTTRMTRSSAHATNA